MKIVYKNISLAELNTMAQKMYGELVKAKEKRIEFDSMINIRPSQGNKTRGVENKDLQKKIIIIVDKLVSE